MRMTIKELQEIETDIVREVTSICHRNKITYYLHCGSALGAVRHGGPIPWDTDVDIIVPIPHFRSFCNAMKKELPKKYYIECDEDPLMATSVAFPRIGMSGFSTFFLHIDIFKLVGTSSDVHKQKEYANITRKYATLFDLKTHSMAYYFANTSLRYCFHRLLLKCIYIFHSKQKVIDTYNSLPNMYPYENSEYVTNPDGHYGMKNVIRKSVYGKGTIIKYGGFEVKIPEHYDEYLRHYYGDYMTPVQIGRHIQSSYEISRKE